MISQDSFSENVKIEATLTIKEKGSGIGFLFAMPETIDRTHLTEGYCLWLASDIEHVKKTKLMRSSVTVLEAPDTVLERMKPIHVRIEKIDRHIYVYINDLLQFSYVSHIPTTGTKVGILAKDADFDLHEYHVSMGSQSITVGCLGYQMHF